MTLVIIAFLILMTVGVPIAFALGISGMFFFFQHTELPFTMTVQLPVAQTQNFALLAVPLFIFAGNLLNACGITERLIVLSKVLTGHMTGGLAQVSVILSTLMGGVSGSSTADAAMEARILGPDMLRSGYSKGYTVSVIGFTAIITSTIPPGIGLIIYGTSGEVSIGRLFAAGLICGLIIMAILMLTVWITAKRHGYKPDRPKAATFREIIAAARESIWALLFPILLLIGIRLGLFTPSEVGAFACVYSVVVGRFIYRELDYRKLRQALIHSVGDVGAVMFLISLTGIFGYGIPYERVPQALTTMVSSMNLGPYAVMYMIIFFLFIAGMFIDGSVCILLLTPIFLPLVKLNGFDPVHFGLILCTTTTLGIMTPPVGIAMYTVCGILDCPLGEYLKRCWPFMLAILCAISIIVFFPGLVLYLPNLLF